MLAYGRTFIIILCPIYIMPYMRTRRDSQGGKAIMNAVMAQENQGMRLGRLWKVKPRLTAHVSNSAVLSVQLWPN